VAQAILQEQFEVWAWSALAGSSALPPPGWQAQAQAHGVLGLLSELGFGDASEVTGCLAQLALAQLSRDRELVRVAQAFKAQGVVALVFKGAALATWLYRPGYLRTRSDTDLLIADPHIEATFSALEGLGYRTLVSANSGLVLAERSAFWTDALGVKHVMDVHWRINSHPRLRECLSLAELRSRATPWNGESALCVPEPVDQFLLAVIHLYGHQRDQAPRMIWLIDISRMWSFFSDIERDTVIKRALEKGVGALCAAALDRANARMATPVHADHLRALNCQAASESSALLRHYRGPLRELLLDLQAQPTWRGRIAWLRDLALPPPAYVRQRYGSRATHGVRLGVRRALNFLSRAFKP